MEDSSNSQKNSQQNRYRSWIRKAFNYFNIEKEIESHDSIYDEILKGIVFKGTNLWILFFAIIIASVGLNMNSTAVIIGAMLISPLMGPINGMGYAMATYNFALFRKAVKNFTFAVVISLVASTAYFAVSPISIAHSELLSRTSPTIYDVLIALFGGLAGIVAISSKQKGNVIPGVAIATALMPPLCAAGYGLASGDLYFFLGAIYLFTINAVFIALAAMGISQVLNFPIRTIVDSKQRQRVNSMTSILTIVVLLPSIYFGYGLVQNEKFGDRAAKFINAVSTYQENYLLKSDVDTKQRKINLVYGGKVLSEFEKGQIKKLATGFELSESNVIIEQGLKFDELGEKENELFTLKQEVNTLHSQLNEKDADIAAQNQKKYVGESLLNEIRSIYPQIESCSYSDALTYSESNPEPVPLAIAVFTLDNNELSEAERQKIKTWLRARINHENLKVIFEYVPAVKTKTN